MTWEYKIYNNSFAIFKSGQKNSTFHSRWGKKLLERKFEFIDEVIASTEEVLVKLNSGYRKGDLEKINVELEDETFKSNHWKIPIWFDDGDDWKNIEKISGLGRTDYIKKLTDASLTVAMFGFTPGFIYLEGLPGELSIPRKTDPAKRVEAGSLGIGGPYAGIYNLPSPGGWNIIGKVGCKIVNQSTLPPIPFQPGDTIRLLSLGRREFDEINKMDIKDFNDTL